MSEPQWAEKLRAGMPKREFQRLLTKDISTDDLRALLAERDQLSDAVLMERERCAKIVESVNPGRWVTGCDAWELAKAIRTPDKP